MNRVLLSSLFLNIEEQWIPLGVKILGFQDLEDITHIPSVGRVIRELFQDGCLVPMPFIYLGQRETKLMGNSFYVFFDPVASLGIFVF